MSALTAALRLAQERAIKPSRQPDTLIRDAKTLLLSLDLVLLVKSSKLVPLIADKGLFNLETDLAILHSPSRECEAFTKAWPVVFAGFDSIATATKATMTSLLVDFFYQLLLLHDEPGAISLTGPGGGESPTLIPPPSPGPSFPLGETGSSTAGNRSTPPADSTPASPNGATLAAGLRSSAEPLNPPKLDGSGDWSRLSDSPNALGNRPCYFCKGKVDPGKAFLLLPLPISGDFPIGHRVVAAEGIHRAYANSHGARWVQVNGTDDLGLKPSERFDVCSPCGEREGDGGGCNGDSEDIATSSVATAAGSTAGGTPAIPGRDTQGPAAGKLKVKCPACKVHLLSEGEVCACSVAPPEKSARPRLTVGEFEARVGTDQHACIWASELCGAPLHTLAGKFGAAVIKRLVRDRGLAATEAALQAVGCRAPGKAKPTVGQLCEAVRGFDAIETAQDRQNPERETAEVSS